VYHTKGLYYKKSSIISNCFSLWNTYLVNNFFKLYKAHNRYQSKSNFL